MRLHVARVILDGDLDALSFSQRLVGLDRFDRVFDVFFDATVGATVFLIAEVTAGDG